MAPMGANAALARFPRSKQVWLMKALIRVTRAAALSAAGRASCLAAGRQELGQRQPGKH
ncbi:hypothetical protein GALL_549010 [mine drainage metagenome]|uniref:Uncharacterized protein n=1 Tax=mine drainage metagenome TaxID=410659 RepID=A0A1J5P6Y8_9ZZZZ